MILSLSTQRCQWPITPSWLSSARIITLGWWWSDLRRHWLQVSELHPINSSTWLDFIQTLSLSSVDSSRYCGWPDGSWSSLFWPVCEGSSVGGKQKLFQGFHGASRHSHGPLRLLHRPAGGLQLHPHVSTKDTKHKVYRVCTTRRLCKDSYLINELLSKGKKVLTQSSQCSR